jgi:hypothetical protein
MLPLVDLHSKLSERSERLTELGCQKLGWSCESISARGSQWCPGPVVGFVPGAESAGITTTVPTVAIGKLLWGFTSLYAASVSFN